MARNLKYCEVYTKIGCAFSTQNYYIFTCKVNLTVQEDFVLPQNLFYVFACSKNRCQKLNHSHVKKILSGLNIPLCTHENARYYEGFNARGIKFFFSLTGLLLPSLWSVLVSMEI